MIADAVKHVVHTLIMLWLLQRHVGGLAGYQIGPILTKSIVAAFFTGITAYATAVLLSQVIPSDTFLGRLVVVTISGLAGLAIYIGAVITLNIQDAKSLWSVFKKKTSN
jgi:hypothetical protein